MWAFLTIALQIIWEIIKNFREKDQEKRVKNDELHKKAEVVLTSGNRSVAVGLLDQLRNNN